MRGALSHPEGPRVAAGDALSVEIVGGRGTVSGEDLFRHPPQHRSSSGVDVELDAGHEHDALPAFERIFRRRRARGDLRCRRGWGVEARADHVESEALLAELLDGAKAREVLTAVAETGSYRAEKLSSAFASSQTATEKALVASSISRRDTFSSTSFSV